MANSIDLQVKTVWGNTLEDDLADQMKGLTGALAVALDGVITITKDRIKSHVKKDVYDKWNPTEYERRREHGGIIDVEGATRVTGPQIGMIGKTPAVAFSLNYKPDGESYQWERPRDGDYLIQRIETGEGYEWGTHPGARPFWQNFVNEMIDQNELGDALYREMIALGIEIDGFPSVSRESGDGEY